MAKCVICKQSVTKDVERYSKHHYYHVVCREHQDYLEESEATDYQVWLYLELCSRDIPVHLEKFDGYKTIDLAIPSSKINIECDGLHHGYSECQALSDLMRTFHSYKKGYFTLRIPNILIDKRTNVIADIIEKMVKET